MNFYSNEKEELEFYRRIFQKLNAAIYVEGIDPYKVEWVNNSPTVKEMLGISPEEAIEKGEFIASWADPDHFRESIELSTKALTENPETKWSGVCKLRNANEQDIWILYSTATFQRDEKNHAEKSVSVGFHIKDLFQTPKSLKDFHQYLGQELYKSKMEKLTDKQHTVLKLLVKGSSAKAISDHLKISKHTVIDHKKAIYKKMDCANMKELMILAGKFGEVSA